MALAEFIVVVSCCDKGFMCIFLIGVGRKSWIVFHGMNMHAAPPIHPICIYGVSEPQWNGYLQIADCWGSRMCEKGENRETKNEDTDTTYAK